MKKVAAALLSLLLLLAALPIAAIAEDANALSYNFTIPYELYSFIRPFPDRAPESSLIELNYDVSFKYERGTKVRFTVAEPLLMKLTSLSVNGLTSSVKFNPVDPSEVGGRTDVYEFTMPLAGATVKAVYDFDENARSPLSAGTKRTLKRLVKVYAQLLQDTDLAVKDLDAEYAETEYYVSLMVSLLREESLREDPEAFASQLFDLFFYLAKSKANQLQSLGTEYLKAILNPGKQAEIEAKILSLKGEMDSATTAVLKSALLTFALGLNGTVASEALYPLLNGIDLESIEWDTSFFEELAEKVGFYISGIENLKEMFDALIETGDIDNLSPILDALGTLLGQVFEDLGGIFGDSEQRALIEFITSSATQYLKAKGMLELECATYIFATSPLNFDAFAYTVRSQYPGIKNLVGQIADFVSKQYEKNVAPVFEGAGVDEFGFLFGKLISEAEALEAGETPAIRNTYDEFRNLLTTIGKLADLRGEALDEFVSGLDLWMDNEQISGSFSGYFMDLFLEFRGISSEFAAFLDRIIDQRFITFADVLEGASLFFRSIIPVSEFVGRKANLRFAGMSVCYLFTMFGSELQDYDLIGIYNGINGSDIPDLIDLLSEEETAAKITEPLEEVGAMIEALETAYENGELLKLPGLFDELVRNGPAAIKSVLTTIADAMDAVAGEDEFIFTDFDAETIRSADLHFSKVLAELRIGRVALPFDTEAADAALEAAEAAETIPELRKITADTEKELGCRKEIEVELQEGEFILHLSNGEKEAVTLRRENGWTIFDGEKYIAMMDGVLVRQREPFAWSYSPLGCFYYEVDLLENANDSSRVRSPKAVSSIFTITYYLSTLQEGSVLEMLPTYVTLYKMTYPRHELRYSMVSENVHRLTCARCGKVYIESEACVFDEVTHECVCGNFDPECAFIEVDVTFYEPVWILFDRLYTADIRVTPHGIRVAKVEYMLENGRSWVSGTHISEYDDLSMFYIRVTDTSGTPYLFICRNGVTSEIVSSLLRTPEKTPVLQKEDYIRPLFGR